LLTCQAVMFTGEEWYLANPFEDRRRAIELDEERVAWHWEHCRREMELAKSQPGVWIHGRAHLPLFVPESFGTGWGGM